MNCFRTLGSGANFKFASQLAEQRPPSLRGAQCFPATGLADICLGMERYPESTLKKVRFLLKANRMRRFCDACLLQGISGSPTLQMLNEATWYLGRVTTVA